MINDYSDIADCAWRAPWTPCDNWRASPVQRDRNILAVYASRDGLVAWAWNGAKGAWLEFHWIIDRWLYFGSVNCVDSAAKEVFRGKAA